MTAIDLKTEIVRLVHEESNPSILEAIRVLLRRTDELDDDISDAEYAEFEAQRARRASGEVKFHSEEESVRMIRSGKTE